MALSDAEFSEKVVLVTGSSSGIGEAIARRFAGLGASVVVNSATSVDAGVAVANDLGDGAIYLQADVSAPDEARELVAATIERFGQLDILVNNAGWTTRVDHDDLDGVSDEIFRRTFDVNVLGTWWVTKAAMPHLQRSSDPNIVNITSIAGVRPVGSSIPYAMSKAALNHMTVLLARSFGPVRVNAVAPGLVATPWTEEWDDLHAALAKRNPVPRSATPEDVAEATLALVRNRYASGEIFVLDGGFTTIA